MPNVRGGLGQGWPISGPRATFVPPQRYQWPAEAFSKMFKSDINLEVLMKIATNNLTANFEDLAEKCEKLHFLIELLALEKRYLHKRTIIRKPFLCVPLKLCPG